MKNNKYEYELIHNVEKFSWNILLTKINIVIIHPSEKAITAIVGSFSTIVAQHLRNNRSLISQMKYNS